MNIFQKLFLICFAIAVLDIISSEIVNYPLLPDFSLVALIMDIFYFVGAGILLIGVIIQRLVFLDITSIGQLIFQFLIVLCGYFFGSAFDFIFDLITMPFSFLAYILGLANLDPTITILDVAGQYLSIDMSSFTIRIGIALDVLGNGAVGGFQISFLGSEAFNHGRFHFSELGFLGIESSVELLLLNQRLGLTTIPFSLEGFVGETFDSVLDFYGTPANLFQSYLEFLT